MCLSVIRYFSGRTDLTSVNFASDSTLASLGDGVFKDCTNLSHTGFPKSLPVHQGKTLSLACGYPYKLWKYLRPVATDRTVFLGTPG
jgi:hypothetical protein